MDSILSNVEQIIILYAPVLLTYITQIVDWIVTLKKFSKLDINKQIAPMVSALKTTNNELKNIKNQVLEFQNDKNQLSENVTILQDSITSMNTELSAIKELLIKLSNENVELKAALRRKSECAVNEQKSV